MTEAAESEGGPASGTLRDDDAVIAFRTIKSGATGRLVKLGASIDRILSSHDYPEPVARVLGEALALTAMLGSQLKFEGRLILQTNTEGPLRVIIVNYETAGTFRGYASFDAEAVAALVARPSPPSTKELMGTGLLALTIDPGNGMERYQGIVRLQGGSLSDAALEYFLRSEQLATWVKLSVAKHYAGGVWRWRAGGLMVQHLTAEGGHEPLPGRDDGTESGWETNPVDESWQRVEMLARTVEDHELTDPLLSPHRLLYRLFHEEGVRADEGAPVAAKCGCTRERVVVFLERFGKAELSDLLEEDGGVTVTCEFCATPYKFSAVEIG
jgi:molecular chaperone Hsp33